MSDHDTGLLLALRSLKDSLQQFLSDSAIRSAAGEDVAEIVEKARLLRNLAETTCRKIDPNWKETA
jgi:hypothetical protein